MSSRGLLVITSSSPAPSFFRNMDTVNGLQYVTSAAAPKPHEEEPPRPSKRDLNIARARAALACAGRALEANRPNGRELPRAAVFFGKAIELLVATITSGEPEASTPRDTSGNRSHDLESIIETLDDVTIKATIDNRRRARDLMRALARPAEAKLRDLERAELFVAKLIEHAQKGRSLRRAERRAIIAIAIMGIALVCVIAGMTFVHFTTSDRLRFHASSTSWGLPLSGRVGNRGAYGLFVHTDEQDHPWVEISLGKERNIHRVTVENRHDCCDDRAVPLVVELRDRAGNYHEVARRERTFDTWTAEFPRQEATAVRLVVPRVSVLHLTNVQIR